MQQQERLAIRYLKIGQSSQCPYYKELRKLFQTYVKILINKHIQQRISIEILLPKNVLPFILIIIFNLLEILVQMQLIVYD